MNIIAGLVLQREKATSSGPDFHQDPEIQWQVPIKNGKILNS